MMSLMEWLMNIIEFLETDVIFQGLCWRESGGRGINMSYCYCSDAWNLKGDFDLKLPGLYRYV